MANRRKRHKHTLYYKAEDFQPDVYLNFVQMVPYERGFKKLKLTDIEQQAIEIAIMSDPQGPSRVEGTGGLRKIRISSERLSKGKSNGFRVGYCYFANHGIVLLLMIYDHNIKDNLSASDKVRIKTLIEEIEMYLKRRSREK